MSWLEKVEVLHMFRISPSQSFCIHKFHRRVSGLMRDPRKMIPISYLYLTNFLISANHTNLSKCNTFIDSQQNAHKTPRTCSLIFLSQYLITTYHNSNNSYNIHSPYHLIRTSCLHAFIKLLPPSWCALPFHQMHFPQSPDRTELCLLFNNQYIQHPLCA